VATQLKIEQVRLSEISLPGRNPRQHSQENLDAIEQSLWLFGQPEPLLVRREDKTIIHGCGRYRAMQNIGWESCRVIYLDVDGAEAWALAVVLNRTGELATWNVSELSATMRDLEGLGTTFEGFGWTDTELHDLITVPPDELERLVDFSPPPARVPPARTGQTPTNYDSTDTDRPVMGRPISVTVEQREIFDLAWERMKERHADDGPELSPGRAVEFLAAEYLASP